MTTHFAIDLQIVGCELHMRLAAGLRPDLLGELWRSAIPLAVIKGGKAKEKVGNNRRNGGSREGKDVKGWGWEGE